MSHSKKDEHHRRQLQVFDDDGCPHTERHHADPAKKEANLKAETAAPAPKKESTNPQPHDRRPRAVHRWEDEGGAPFTGRNNASE